MGSVVATSVLPDSAKGVEDEIVGAGEGFDQRAQDADGFLGRMDGVAVLPKPIASRGMPNRGRRAFREQVPLLVPYLKEGTCCAYLLCDVADRPKAGLSPHSMDCIDTVPAVTGDA